MLSGNYLNYLLDTNMVSHLLRGDEIGNQLRRRMIVIPTSRFGISTLTEAQLLYGLAKKPEATHLRTAVHKFLADCETLPWDSAAAHPMPIFVPEVKQMASQHLLSIC